MTTTNFGPSSQQTPNGAPGTFVALTTAQLQGTPDITAINAGPTALFYDSANPSTLYRVNNTGTAFVRVAYPGAISGVSPNTVCAFGDSLTAYNNIFSTPTTASRTNGIATITCSAGHTLATDGIARIFGIDNTFNTASTPVTRVSGTVFTYVNPGPDVAAFTPNATYARVIQKSGFSNVSIFQYANSYLSCVLRLVDNFGQSSETTNDMVKTSRLTELANTSAAMVWVLAGSNDSTNAGISVAQTCANLLTIYNTVLATGKSLVMLTIPPLGTGHGSFATATPKIIQINAWIRQQARALPGAILVDIYGVMVDSTLTGAQAGGAKANMLQSDNIHWQVYGARTAGREIGRVLTPMLSPGQVLITNPAEYRANDAGYANVWLGTPWTSSGGTVTAPVTGTAASGLNVACTAGGTATASVVSDGSGIGNAQQVVHTPAAASDTVTIQQQSAATAAAFLTAGEQYVFRCHIKTSGAQAANLSYIRIRIQAIIGGVTMSLGTPLNSSVAGANNVFADIDDIFESPPMIIPSGGSITSLTVEVIAAYSSVGSALTLQAGRMSFDRLSS